MDKTTPQLDPKLREAYDRVMGTVVTPPPPANPEPVSIPPVQPVMQQPAQTVNVQSPTTEKAAQIKKKRKVSPLIIVLGVIIFLAVYAVVWVKYFGLTVPFLNP